jgi:hypothetical protein
LLPLVTVVAFTTIIIGARVLAVSTSAVSDPFFAYIDVFPGHTRGDAEAQGFSCPASFFDATGGIESETCITWPKTGPFLQVNLHIVDNMIQEIEFVVRGTKLRVGDLITLWGQPRIREAGTVRYYRWTGSHQKTATYVVSGWRGLISPLRIVSITKSG